MLVMEIASKDEGPGSLIGVEPRALDAQRLGRRLCKPVMPRRPGAVQCAVGEGGLGQLEEPATYRLYNCHRCRRQVCICAQCDCGNLYCPGECAELSRRESVRRAGARYQRSFRGARKHAERQRRYRERRKSEVTHHTFSLVTTGCSVLRHPATASELIDVDSKELLRPSIFSLHRCCAFCGRLLPDFARLHPWHWDG
jgi:hypothetical protein